jgi:hypothetical protein
MSERSRRLWFVPLAALLVLVAGCEGESRAKKKGKATAHSGATSGTTTASGTTGDTTTPKVQVRETVGKRTQTVLPLEPELAKGARIASTQITATDPISGPGNAYVTTAGKVSMQQVDYAIEMYNASNGEYPKDYQEFMDGVLKVGQPDGLQLPQLPAYQEYAYDAANHKLVVLEYPERREELKRQFYEKLNP